MGIARVALSTKLFATGAAGRTASTARGYLDAFIAVGLFALFLVTFVIRPFYIPSVSMVPTLQVRDVVLVDEIAYRLHAPEHGEVAVFTPPVNSGGNDFVKRVIGVPGDSIVVANGIVYRNGAPLLERYENQPPRYTLAIRNYGIYANGSALDPRQADVPPRALWQAPNRIPNGFYFVLGDDRNYSDDSHVWGFVRARNFVGRAFFIIWPLGRVRALAR